MAKEPSVCPVAGAAHLDSALRRRLYNPQKILSSFVKEGMTVLDVGCGPGLFSVAMAEMVGATGRVIAADLQQGMLDKLREKIAGTPLQQRIELHKCEADTIGIRKKVDFVLAFWMVHETPNQQRFFAELASLLCPDGLMLIVEPKIHVPKKRFEAMLSTILANGHFEQADTALKVFFSRVVVYRAV